MLAVFMVNLIISRYIRGIFSAHITSFFNLLLILIKGCHPLITSKLLKGLNSFLGKRCFTLEEKQKDLNS